MAAGRRNLKTAQKVGLFSSWGLCQCCAVVPAVILAAIFGVTRIAALTSPNKVTTQETLLSILTLDFLSLLPDRRELWNTLRQQATKQLQSFSESENVQICIVGYVSAVFIVLTMSLIKKLQVFVTKRKPKRGRPKKNPEVETFHVQSWYRTAAMSLLVLLVFSLGWEWVRMYQIEAAKKAATVHVGFPAECSTDSIGTWTSIKSWMRWHLSWSRDPCEQYHQALLVDPFWEVNPLMVLTATVTRCIVRPVELISAGAGSSLRLLFQEIPSPWQPVVMATVVLALVLTLTMTCRYRIRFPLFFSLEPSSNKSEPAHPLTSTPAVIPPTCTNNTNAIEDTKDCIIVEANQNGRDVKDGHYNRQFKLLKKFSTPSKKSADGGKSPYAELQGSPSRNGGYNHDGVKSLAATM
ncbi:uncharacterized protein LOC144867367 [Branchiostoma floridae x Branchiostoma japonicum]